MSRRQARKRACGPLLYAAGAAFVALMFLCCAPDEDVAAVIYPTEIAGPECSAAWDYCDDGGFCVVALPAITGTSL